MFRIDVAGRKPITGNAAMFTGRDGKSYFSVEGSQNGLIDPAYLLVAYAFDRGLGPAQVTTNYQLDRRWKIAVEGLGHLASSIARGFSYDIQTPSPAKPVTLSAPDGAVEVSVDGEAPPTVAVLESKDIFTPNAREFHNIPRLYLMAALAMEELQGASVACLVVNDRGGIVATGWKGHGEVGCGHAEMKALFSIKGLVPDRCMIFSTLKPCTMCAGLIQAVSSSNAKQFWARLDPSNGADYRNVRDLGLPNGLASNLGARETQKVREIKIKGKVSFTDAFGQAWDGRGRLQKGEPELTTAAYEEWCKQRMLPGKMVGKTTKGTQIRVAEKVADAQAKALAAKSIANLKNRSDLFERKRQNENAWKQGLDEEAKEAIVKVFEQSSQYASVKSAKVVAEKEKNMGIIEFIGTRPTSTNLRTAARKAFEAKHAKYYPEATAEADGAATAVVVRDDRMPVLVDYLWSFVQSQRQNGTGQ